MKFLTDEERRRILRAYDDMQAAKRQADACLDALDTALGATEEDRALCRDALLAAWEYRSYAYWYAGVAARNKLAPIMETIEEEE